MKCFMGIDCGTSGIKVVLLSEAGELLGSGYSECDLITPGRAGWSSRRRAGGMPAVRR